MFPQPAKKEKTAVQEYTIEEKRQMAEKRRFKQNREFKKRLDEQEENAEADIRSFKFRSLEKKESNREFRRDEEKKAFSKDDRGNRKPFRKNDRDDRKSFRKNDRDKKSFKKNNRRFNDDDED